MAFDLNNYLSPFQYAPSSQYRYPADSPVFYTPTINTRNILNDFLMTQMPAHGISGNPYANSPILAALRGTAGALQRQAPSTPGWQPNYALQRQGLLNIANPAWRAAAMAEPNRLQNVMKALLSSYGSAGDIYASQQGGKAKREQAETQGDAGRLAAWNQIPLVGGLLGGLFG